jgi:hypothetical protein
LDEIIAFLNDKNREYADYNWSVWADNCAYIAERIGGCQHLVATLGAGR